MIKSEKFWDFIAKGYDRGEDDPSERPDITILKKYLKTGDVVLDYACGTGTLSIEIAPHVKLVHAVDISSRMLAAARSKAEVRKIENIVFTQSTLYDENFLPQTFDVILAFNVLHLLEDVRQTSRRIYELLKPGGFFISSTPCLGDKKILVNRMFVPFILALSKIGIIPFVRLFKIPELEEIFRVEKFQSIETRLFVSGISDYLIVTRKTG